MSVVEMAGSDNEKAMLFFELADRGLIDMADAAKARKGAVAGKRREREREQKRREEKEANKKKDGGDEDSSSSSAAVVEAAPARLLSANARPETPIAVGPLASPEAAVRACFNAFFGTKSRLNSLHRKLPEIDDFSAIDEQLMVSVGADAEQRVEEGRAMREEHEAAAEAAYEADRAEKEERRAAEERAYEAHVARSISDSRRASGVAEAEGRRKRLDSNSKVRRATTVSSSTSRDDEGRRRKERGSPSRSSSSASSSSSSPQRRRRELERRSSVSSTRWSDRHRSATATSPKSSSLLTPKRKRD